MNIVHWGDTAGGGQLIKPLTGDLRATDLPANLNYVSMDQYIDSIGQTWEIQAAAEAEALRLEKRTELNEVYADYVSEGLATAPETIKRLVCVRDYGSGLVEVGYSIPDLKTLPSDSELEARSKEKEKLTEEELEQLRFNNLERSIRRTKAQVRRKCMAGGLDHMLTLTYRENIQDIHASFSDLKRFIRLVREVKPDWKYLAVHELQQRGAVHFHVAVKGFQDVRLLRRLWLRVVSQGNIDVKGPGVRGPSIWQRAKLAMYLTKYITKGLCAAFARQRYRVAQGIELPKSLQIIEFPLGFDFVSEIFDSLGLVPSFRWDSKQGPYGWACSW